MTDAALMLVMLIVVYLLTKSCIALSAKPPKLPKPLELFAIRYRADVPEDPPKGKPSPGVAGGRRA